MKRLISLLGPVTLMLAGVLPGAYAQTAANITVLSGNGQLVCPLCPAFLGSVPTQFDPLYVKVTDSNGNPVQNAPVTWTVVPPAPGTFASGATSEQTFTDSNGVASDTYFVTSVITGGINNPYIQSSITAAISGGASVTFYETQALANTSSQGNNSPSLVNVQLQTPASFPPCPSCASPGDTVTGNAGSTASVQFKVQVYAPGTNFPVVPNVVLRLISNQTSPTISCATQAGADPGSVLTGPDGTATCTAVFGPTSGTGSFYVQVGGVSAASLTGAPQGFFQSGNYHLVVQPGLASAFMIVSGNNQSGTPGQAIASPLVASVVDAAGNPLSGQAVVWTVVSPANGATLSNTTTTSDANGRVQTNVALANSASGQVTVKVALAGNSSVSTTFTLTATVQVSGLQIISGNTQSAVVNTTFATPLTVQLNAANGQSVAGIPVTFSVTGPATLSNSTVTTNSNGQATVTAIAGATTGPVVVTATAGGQNAVFTLTVIAQGPTLTTGSFYNGADFQPGSLSPCSIASIIAPGLAPAIQGVVAYDGVGALPYTLASDSVTFGGAQAPLFSVSNVNGQQQITLQVPCSVTPGNVAVTVNVGNTSSTITIPINPASPGLFQTQFTAGTASTPVLERPDGSFVSPQNPAHKGETLIAFVTGLGPMTPAVATNALPAPGSNPTIQGTIIVGMNGQGVTSLGASPSPDLIAVQTVSFVVPSTTPSGNATFSIGVLYPSSGSTVYFSNLGVFPVQ